MIDLLANEGVQAMILALLGFIFTALKLSASKKEALLDAAEVGFAFAEKMKLKGDIQDGAAAMEKAVEVAKANLPKAVKLQPGTDKSIRNALEHVHSLKKLAEATGK